jgi:hypothetical protein
MHPGCTFNDTQAITNTQYVGINVGRRAEPDVTWTKVGDASNWAAGLFNSPDTAM